MVLKKKKTILESLLIHTQKGGGKAKAWVGSSPGQDFINFFD